MFLGAPITKFGVLTNKAGTHRRARAALARLDPAIDVAAPLGSLRVAQRQIVEIAKALLAQARVIAMDEPTSSLTPHEFERLAEVIESLEASGVAVVYVSHKLEEVYRVASRATVLRDGRLVGSVNLKEVGEDKLIAMMVGRELETRARRSFATGEYIFAVGGNEEAARISGVPIARTKIAAYAISGFLAALGAVILVARLGAAEPTLGNLWELEAIAASAIGGASLMGGKGSIVGMLLCAIVLGAMRNGLTLMNVQAFYQLLATGIIIILAMLVDRLTRGKE